MSPERTIGETIRSAREQRGVSQEGLSQGTRISLSVIRKLERDRFEELPGGLYTRNFIRNIADFLELDADALIARLGGRDPVAAASAAESKKARESRSGVDVWQEESVKITRFRASRRHWWRWALALFVLVAAATLWLRPGWFGLDFGGEGGEAPVALDAGEAGAEPVQREGSATPPADVGGVPANDFAGPVITDAADAGAESAPALGNFLLEIHALGDCRVSLTVDGERHFGRRFPKRGGRWTLRGDEYFLLSATEAGRLRLRLNGEEYPLPGLGREPLVALRIAPSDL